jgi:P2-related tail formation protein|tara:strand:+ start:62 stop:370 length:309 start_codon:yes stop_codon:yes gene_type:complete
MFNTLKGVTMKLNNGTLISVKTAVEIIGALVIIVLWFTTIKAGVQANTKTDERIMADVAENCERITKIDDGYHAIKGDVREMRVRQEVMIKSIDEIKLEVKK